jgi:transposase
MRFNVSRASVYNYLQLDQDLGDLTPQKSTGRNRRIPAEQEPDLQAQIQAFPDDTLEQHCERWTKQTGVSLSIACMHNSIVRAKISLKKNEASQRTRSQPKNETKKLEQHSGLNTSKHQSTQYSLMNSART